MVSKYSFVYSNAQNNIEDASQNDTRWDETKTYLHYDATQEQLVFKEDLMKTDTK